MLRQITADVYVISLRVLNANSLLLLHNTYHLNLSIKTILFLQNKVAYTRDEHSYKQLFFHFHGPLLRFANGMVNNHEIAEEIVSDTMMKVWDAGSKLAQIDKLNLYLFTTTKNACLTYLSKKKLEMAPIEHGNEPAITDNQTPETQLIVSEIEQQINGSIKNLPPQCQMVYRLIKDEGFSYKEVSSILEVSQNTIETQMRIALKRIRQCLTDYLSKK